MRVFCRMLTVDVKGQRYSIYLDRENNITDVSLSGGCYHKTPFYLMANNWTKSEILTKGMQIVRKQIAEIKKAKADRIARQIESTKELLTRLGK